MLLADGKTPHERRFGESLKGPVIPFGALVEYLPSSARDQARLHQFGKKVLPVIFSRLWIDRGENLERRYSDSRHRRIREFGGVRSLSRKIECEGSLANPQKSKFVFPVADVQQNCQEETTNCGNPL